MIVLGQGKSSQQRIRFPQKTQSDWHFSDVQPPRLYPCGLSSQKQVMCTSTKNLHHFPDGATQHAYFSKYFSLRIDCYGSPERVVRLGELGDLQVAHLEIAHVVHGDLELHRHRADLRSENPSPSTKVRQEGKPAVGKVLPVRRVDTTLAHDHNSQQEQSGTTTPSTHAQACGNLKRKRSFSAQSSKSPTPATARAQVHLQAHHLLRPRPGALSERLVFERVGARHETRHSMQTRIGLSPLFGWQR